MQETNGDINGAIQSCEKVMELLKDLEIKGLSFNERIKKICDGCIEAAQENCDQQMKAKHGTERALYPIQGTCKKTTMSNPANFTETVHRLYQRLCLLQ